MEFYYLLVGVIIGGIIGYLIAKVYYWMQNKKTRKQAIGKSKSIITGQVYEQIAPLLPQIKYNPKDMTFVGKGVDYIVLDGISNGNLKKIVFLEIKTGKSQQNKNEKAIQQTIKNKNVEYELIKI
ncbi:Holliday junction resolvase-like protein [Candidatus Absconditicoccus praedator]|uniref:Holliday junction resolvase-like protein n=1 Tax=Candidatus Absconditicoccus praedator TaxID=2735562 RepID=UPI001E4A0E08|nr:Holliday junction resolvase-like protein [Candidatus Absconditicoccus praedator]UFX83040.1 hypothetical protein HLG78_02795 [Candidatus Absconditicoccus praedator]